MEQTGRYSLPLIMPQQAQKHVTHNEALTLIDALAFPVISAFGFNTPPANPATDSAWFTGSTPTGAWYDQPTKLAFFTDAGWRFAAPRKGMIALDDTTSHLVHFNGTGWVSLANTLDLNNLASIGINTSADATNRLAVQTNAVLATAIPTASGGNGDLQLKVNKEGVADTGSLLFQTGWSGRAEMGLAGDDNFSIKVSADGTSWKTAIAISGNSGLVSLTDASIANPALANMDSGSVKGRKSAGTGQVEDLNGAEVAGLLPVFAPTSKGLVPASGGTTTAVLRSDGVWAEPDIVSGPSAFRAFNDFAAVNQTQDWTYLTAGTSAAFSNGPFGAANSIGAAYCNLGTTATGRASISGSALNYFQFGQGKARFRTRLKINTLSDATNGWILRAGFLDSTTAESTDCAAFRYTHSANGGRFVALTRANNVETAFDTGITVTAGEIYILEIIVPENASSITFHINNVLVATISSTIPVGTGRELGYSIYAQKTAGTTNILAYLCDYALVETAFTNAR